MAITGKKTYILKDIPGPLQAKLQASSLVCPLCSSIVPARGLRPKPDPGLPLENWEVVFTCPACGLLSTFDLQHVSPRLLKSIQGSQWSTLLRQYHEKPTGESNRQERQATVYHFFSVFVISLLTWIILTGSLQWIDLAWGGVACLIVARFSYRSFAFELPHWITSPRRWVAFFSLLFALARQLIKQNISLSIRVLSPKLNIRPGIVAIPTKLIEDVPLTLLGSLVTLTPDTVTVDIDQDNCVIYVHWIDVQATSEEEIIELISAEFEEKVIRWLL